ncbi:MAG: hypothetical protein LC754_04320, partial [Acidobacteria bacterium]|nr:hypothetical protein [Acidobacteriota bacterium]
LSALGALRSDVVKNLSRTVMLDVEGSGGDDRATPLERTFQAMEREARAALRREGFDEAKQRHERTIAARYKGQSFELEINWNEGRAITKRFHRAHEARYGYAQAAQSVEIVSVRLRSVGAVEKLKPERLRGQGEGRTRTAKPKRYARVHLDDGQREVAVYAREELAAGARLKSPCVVAEYSSTTLVPAGARAAIDARGNLIIEP